MKKVFCIPLLILFLIIPGQGSAATFDSILALGDSLTDDSTGQLDPFGIARFTDGPIWVELVAGAMGANLYDGAFGGATTGMDNPAVNSPILGLQWQVGNVVPFFLPYTGLDSTLFSIWAGANDFFQGRNPFTGANNVGLALNSLGQVGAQDILIMNLPDIGMTPGFYNDVNQAATSAEATAWTMAFNGALLGEMELFKNNFPDINLFYVDIFSLFREIIEVDDQGVILDMAEWVSLFWDPVHPSSIGHELIADAVLRKVVPEPSTVILFSIGLLGLARINRRTRM